MGTMTDTLTGQGWCERYDVTLDWSADGYQRDEQGWEHHAYTITLHHGINSVSLAWRQGMAVDDEPTADRVLWAVARDAEAGRMDFNEFVDEFGYDEPKSAYATWRACRESSRKLYDFMASEAMWDDFQSITESD